MILIVLSLAKAGIPKLDAPKIPAPAAVPVYFRKDRLFILVFHRLFFFAIMLPPFLEHVKG
jgi:hypothetical protein